MSFHISKRDIAPLVYSNPPRGYRRPFSPVKSGPISARKADEDLKDPRASRFGESINPHRESDSDNEFISIHADSESSDHLESSRSSYDAKGNKPKKRKSKRLSVWSVSDAKEIIPISSDEDEGLAATPNTNGTSNSQMQEIPKIGSFPPPPPPKSRYLV
jgi:hypothetical protein